MSVREKVRSLDERNGGNTKMPLRVICKLVSTGLYCACPPADIVPLMYIDDGVGGDMSVERSRILSDSVRQDLASSGFTANDDKSI